MKVRGLDVAQTSYAVKVNIGMCYTYVVLMTCIN